MIEKLLLQLFLRTAIIILSRVLFKGLLYKLLCTDRPPPLAARLGSATEFNSSVHILETVRYLRGGGERWPL
jgi:hypothetical protein